MGFLFAGLEPTFRAASSSSGVALRKNGTKSGVSRTTFRYAAHDSSESLAIVWRHLSSTFRSSEEPTWSLRIAAVKISSVRSAIFGSPKLNVIISPCSVTRNRPWIVSGGWAKIARYVSGLPPLPTVPPLPWKNVGSTPNCWHTASIFSWPSYWAHQAANRPASFAESE